MKRIIIFLSIIILITSLSGCSFVDPKIINETYKPNLKASPINGIWSLKRIITSDSRYSFEEGDKFYFNIDFFATSDKIYLNPDYEIVSVNWDRYSMETTDVEKIQNILENEKVNVVEIKRDGLIIAEAIPINDSEILLNIWNEILLIQRETDTLTSEEKNELKRFYSEREKVFRAGDSWALALGVRSLREDVTSTISQYDYYTVLFRFSDKGLRVDNLDGIVINNDSLVDVYDIERVTREERDFDRILLNGEELFILDNDNLTQSDIFRLNYLSQRYATLEYIYPEKDKLNTLSTYTTTTRGGFNQLKIDDIVSYSTERVMDAITKSNSETTYSQAIYNIGMSRDSGFTVLKGRVVSRIDEDRFNSDYIISSNFSYANELGTRKVNFQEIKNSFPEVVDVFSTPIDNQYVLITKTGVEIIRFNRITREYEEVYSREFNANTSVISNSWFNQSELEDVEKILITLRVK